MPSGFVGVPLLDDVAQTEINDLSHRQLVLLLASVLWLRLDQNVVYLNVIVDDSSLVHVGECGEHVLGPALQFVFPHSFLIQEDLL